MRPTAAVMLLAALVGCAPSLARFDDLADTPALDVRGDVAPAEDAGRPDVADDASDATDGSTAPADAQDGGTDAAEVTPDADAGDATEASADAADVRDATGADPCSGACAMLPHVARATCGVGASCVVRECERGFADCNRAGVDGCETPTTTRLDCGSCGNRCFGPDVCAGGECR